MDKYNYVNEYEREYTEKYAGIYSAEEVVLNNRLSEECEKKEIDPQKIEALLKEGADPLGGSAVCGWGVLDHVYGELIGPDCANLPKITELFLKHGMNVDRPRVPYDGANSLNPLWEFAFAADEYGIRALKMLLDNGLSPDGFSEFVGHSLSEFTDEGGDPEDETRKKEYVWTLKMIMLGASYDHIISEDEDLREFICLSLNEEDVHIFRNWDDFEYRFDTSHCPKDPEPYGSIVRIYSKKTGKEVWSFGVGAEAREIPENVNSEDEKTRG